MAAVHLASFHVPSSGFSRIVAVKLLHPHFAKVPDVRAMFLDEARIVSHIRHANVVSTLDVIDDDGELVLVMDYVDGPSLSVLLRKVSASGGHIPIPVAVAMSGGYCPDIEAIVSIHVNTIKEAVRSARCR